MDSMQHHSVLRRRRHYSTVLLHLLIKLHKCFLCSDQGLISEVHGFHVSAGVGADRFHHFGKPDSYRSTKCVVPCKGLVPHANLSLICLITDLARSSLGVCYNGVRKQCPSRCTRKLIVAAMTARMKSMSDSRRGTSRNEKF